MPRPIRVPGIRGTEASPFSTIRPSARQEEKREKRKEKKRKEKANFQMPASSPAHPTIAGSAGPCEVHRKLQDKVLQSAEDAVLAQAVSSGRPELPPLQ